MKKHRGYSLIEVVCSLALLSIVISVTIFISQSSTKIRNRRIMEEQYYSYIDILKKQIKYNSQYEDIREIFILDKKYIHCNKLILDNIKSCDILELFTDEVPKNKPYIEVYCEEESPERVLKIVIDVKQKYEHRKISCVFYKGDF